MKILKLVAALLMVASAGLYARSADTYYICNCANGAAYDQSQPNLNAALGKAQQLVDQKILVGGRQVKNFWISNAKNNSGFCKKSGFQQLDKSVLNACTKDTSNGK